MNNTRYLSENASAELINAIKKMGCDVLTVGPAENVNTPIASHPDIQMCRLGFHANDPVVFAEQVEIASIYPEDVAFNAACTGRYFIHNLKYTNPRLLSAAKSSGMTLVDCKQGYAKCSTVIVDEKSIITYDEGLALACRNAGMDVLTVRPGHVILEGYNTGFIGGCSGRIGDTIIFNGNINQHPDGDSIIKWIESRGLKCLALDYPLTDIGSII